MTRKRFWKLGNRVFNTHYFDIDKDGDLIVREGNNQYNLRFLAQKFGTPLEVVFPFILEERLEDLMDLFAAQIKALKYRGKFFYHYPMKVNQNKEVVMPLVSEGANLEVSSANELWLVKRMWEQETFNPKIRVICNGPKTDKYIRLIDELQHRGLTVIPVIEGPNEVSVFGSSRFEVGVRVDIPPSVSVQSRWDKTIDKFGFSEAELMKLGRMRNLQILHYHIGSQIERQSDILHPLRYALQVYAKLRKINPTLDTIDIGGGMPIPYDRKVGYAVTGLVRQMLTIMREYADRHRIPHPNLIAEWGRYMVAPAQVTIYKVIDVKAIAKGTAKKWYVVDGSFMNDLLDTWAIHQKWHVLPASNLHAKKLVKTWMAGSSCDSDDKYTGQNSYVLLPDFDPNTTPEPLYVTFLDSGAYQDPLASHHCLLSSPAKLIAENGHIIVARKRESAEEVGKLFGW
ncbi:MAG: hypothetical protein PHI63_01535 [Patescibacteria group bacterium]|nr:hypothetical protein [Patescibacteria group bacterium]